MYIGYYNSPIGLIRVEGEKDYIRRVSFVHEKLEEENIGGEVKKCLSELNSYFNGELKDFSVKTTFENGTEFRKTVWNELKNIPYGEVISYKDMAVKIGNPKGCRAVGGANNKNPIGIIVPCHRVVGAKGDLVGYAEGVDKKKFLLELENRFK